MSNIIHLTVDQADQIVVQNLLDHLVKAFEKFADGMADMHPEGLRYVDALMGCHNFYKTIILDMERRNPDCGSLYRNIAVTTLATALNAKVP